MRHGAGSLERGVAVAVVGFFALCLPLFAQQQTDRTNIFSLNRSVFRVPSLALSDQRPFYFSQAAARPLYFSWIDTSMPPDFLTALPTGASNKDTATERRGYSALW